MKLPLSCCVVLFTITLALPISDEEAAGVPVKIAESHLKSDDTLASQSEHTNIGETSSKLKSSSLENAKPEVSEKKDAISTITESKLEIGLDSHIQDSKTDGKLITIETITNESTISLPVDTTLIIETSTPEDNHITPEERTGNPTLAVTVYPEESKIQGIESEEYADKQMNENKTNVPESKVEESTAELSSTSAPEQAQSFELAQKKEEPLNSDITKFHASELAATLEQSGAILPVAKLAEDSEFSAAHESETIDALVSSKITEELPSPVSSTASKTSEILTLAPEFLEKPASMVFSTAIKDKLKPDNVNNDTSEESKESEENIENSSSESEESKA
jgi:hypothetical protein